MPPAAIETWQWGLIGLLALIAAWAAVVVVLAVLGRRSAARALAAFVPDCAVLVRRLLGDARVPRRRKVGVGLAAAYLAFPFDLIPDFLPVIGQLDDALVVIVVLRYLLRGGSAAILQELWPGPPESLRVVLRLAGVDAADAAAAPHTIRTGSRRLERARQSKERMSQ